MSGGGGDNEVKDTPEQKYLAQVAAEKWNLAQDKLAPLENEYMATVDQMDSEQNMSYIRGRTMQAQTQALGGAQDGYAKGMTQAGIDPSSGRFQGEMAGLAMDVADSGGETLGRAQFEQDNQKILGLQNIVAIGQGQSGQAQAGLSGLAQQSSANAISEATQNFNRRSANLQLIGSVAGAGARYGMKNDWFKPAADPGYSMNTNFDASPNRFGLDDSRGGFYNYAGG
ncbi:hypothetical protein [Marinobacter sp. MDS2]|uniref:hypothetical protein n=1 Tax=Marinobacter sp. MDS2 TaxID=3065961 RepID=UPI00273AFF36|nr:hypothetical protein [Marinobacter sp. MDS2]MDP4546479.1 hypothetical protein [Marinobacter sp. MDS2]